MRANPIKSIAYITLIVAGSFLAVYLLNKGYLDTAQKEVVEINPDKFSEDSKNAIEYGDIVKITGTPNLLQQVSQEPTKTSDLSDKTTYYYVGLKEYGFDFVVKVKKGKVVSESQTFIGKVTGLSNTEFGSRIKNSLNKPINFDDSVNQEISKELDQESKDKISTQSEAKFTDTTLLVLDEEVIDLNGIYTNIIMYSVVLSVFFITLFRKRIFPGLNRK